MKSTSPEKREKALLLLGLYISQTLGLAFITTAVPVILRQSGAGLDKISLVFVLGLFWSTKFLWAPIVDRYGSKKYGHYRSWIIILQTLMITTTVTASFFSVSSQLPFLSLLFIMLAFFSASQDIASDGLSVNILKPEERGLGSSTQSAGNMIGFMLGGGVVLFVYQWLGWQGSLLVLAGGMVIPLISILSYKEHPYKEVNSRDKTNYKALVNFFRRPNIWHWIAILLIFRINYQITYWLLNPFLVDSGWSIERIGIAMNGFGIVFGIIGSVLGGTTISHWDRKKIMLISMILGIIGTSSLVALIKSSASSVSFIVYVSIGLIMIAYGFSSTVMYTVIMDRCNPESGATDFTLQWSLTGVSAMSIGGLAMALAEYIGYTWVLVISIGIALLSIILIQMYKYFKF